MPAADPLRFRRLIGPGIVEIGCEYPPGSSVPAEVKYPLVSSVAAIPGVRDPGLLLVTLTREGVVAFVDAGAAASCGAGCRPVREVELRIRGRRGSGWRAPIHATPAADFTYLVCDEEDEACWWLAADGSAVATFEARAYGCSSAPTSAAQVGELFVITFPLDGAIVAVDRTGSPAWIHRRSPEVSRPHSVVAGPNGHLLVADAWEHTVVEIDSGRAGSRRTVFGQADQPGVDGLSLNNPRSAAYGPSGQVVIADSKNNRILRLDRHGAVTAVLNPSRQPAGGTAGLYFPIGVACLPNGDLVVADTGNDRVVAFGSVAASARLLLGEKTTRVFHLAHPRGAHIDDAGSLVVTDSYNDRALAGSGATATPVASGPLTWPRFATTAAAGTVIADGRGAGRIILVPPPNGSPRPKPAELRTFSGPSGRLTLEDPHHIHPLAGDRAIVVDSATGVIAGVRLRSATVEWHHTGFHDPHMAMPLIGGALLVSNTGADEVVEIDRDGNRRWSLGPDEVAAATGTPLRGPRCARRLADGSTLVLDSDNGRVLHHSADRRTVTDLLRSLSTPLHLKTPRWLHTDAEGRYLLLSDFDGHRLVAVDLVRAATSNGGPTGRPTACPGPWADLLGHPPETT